MFTFARELVTNSFSMRGLAASAAMAGLPLAALFTLLKPI